MIVSVYLRHQCGQWSMFPYRLLWSNFCDSLPNICHLL